MAEIELSHLSRQCLRGRIAAKATLINKVQAWNTQRNEKHAKPIGSLRQMTHA